MKKRSGYLSLLAAFTAAASLIVTSPAAILAAQDDEVPADIEEQAAKEIEAVGPPVFKGYEQKTSETDFEEAEVKTAPDQPEALQDVTVMYRLYNPWTGEHFYTASEEERQSLIKDGWMDEDIAWYAPKSGDPVFRMCNPNNGDHHYTLNEEERDELVKLGWNYEGVGWNSDPDKSQPLYRLYNPNAQSGSHHYTLDSSERQFLIGHGWVDEEIGWYGVKNTFDPSIRIEKDGYCYSENGVKHVGIQKIDGRYSYFDPANNGKKSVFSGLKTTTENDVIFGNGDGTLYTGPKTVDGKQYWFLRETGKAARNEFRFVGGEYLSGAADFAWFNDQGQMERKAADVHQQAAFQIRTAGISYFSDPETGASMRVWDYIRDHYSNGRLNQLMEEAIRYESWPYVWAGKSPLTGFDCSGLVTWCMKYQWNINVDPIMTNAAAIYVRYCQPVAAGSEQPGDLVFWRGTYGTDPNYVSHVGIYVGNGWVYAAGDPIGFYPVDASLRPDGSVAPWFFGRV